MIPQRSYTNCDPMASKLAASRSKARLYTPSAQGFATGSLHAACGINQSLVHRATAAGQLHKQHQVKQARYKFTPFAAAAGNHAAGATATPATSAAAADNISRFYAALNRRDLAAVSRCLAAEVQYENLAIQDSLAGQQAVTRFYQDLLATVPDEAVCQLDQVTAGEPNRTAVVWRLTLPSSQILVSRGLSFYTLDDNGLITHVTECYEPAVKVSHQQLLLMRSLVAPLLNNFAEPVLPAAQEVNRTLQQGLDSLLQPLAALGGLLDPLVNPAADYTPQTPSSSSSGGGGTSSTIGSVSPSPQQHASAAAAAAAAAAAGTARTPSPFSDTPAGQRAASRVAAAKQARITRKGITTPPPPPSVPSTPAAAAVAYATASGKLTGTSRMAVPPSAAGSPGAAAANRGDGAAAAVPAAPVNNNFSGVWVKDPLQSDAKGYEATLDVLGLSGLQKVTARLIEGVEIQQTSSNFSVSFITVVPFFKVTENVPLNGGSAQLNRRDLRPGSQKTTAKAVLEGVLVEMSWGPPMAGRLTELYSLLPNGCLAVKADTRVGQKAASSVTVYTRTAGSRDTVLADSKKRNGSVAEVLQQQRDKGLSM